MSALVKHQIECPTCPYQGLVVSDEEFDAPGFCPQCGSKLDEYQDVTEEVKG